MIDELDLDKISDDIVESIRKELEKTAITLKELSILYDTFRRYKVGFITLPSIQVTTTTATTLDNVVNYGMPPIVNSLLDFHSKLGAFSYGDSIRYNHTLKPTEYHISFIREEVSNTIIFKKEYEAINNFYPMQHYTGGLHNIVFNTFTFNRHLVILRNAHKTISKYITPEGLNKLFIKTENND